MSKMTFFNPRTYNASIVTMTGVVAAKFVDRTVFYANNRLVFITKFGLKKLSFKYFNRSADDVQ